MVRMVIFGYTKAMATRGAGKKTWAIHEAKAELAALIHAAEEEGPQLITRHGQPVAAIVSASEFTRLQERGRRVSLSAFFASAGGELEVPERDRNDHTREIDL